MAQFLLSHIIDAISAIENELKWFNTLDIILICVGNSWLMQLDAIEKVQNYVLLENRTS